MVMFQPAAAKIWCGRASSSAQYPVGWMVPSLRVHWFAAETTINTDVIAIFLSKLRRTSATPSGVPRSQRSQAGECAVAVDQWVTRLAEMGFGDQSDENGMRSHLDDVVDAAVEGNEAVKERGDVARQDSPVSLFKLRRTTHPVHAGEAFRQIMMIGAQHVHCEPADLLDGGLQFQRAVQAAQNAWRLRCQRRHRGCGDPQRAVGADAGDDADSAC